MTRQEVYNTCVEKFYPSLEAYEEGVCSVKQLLPQEAIDAIIDCAVEEAVQRISQMTFAKIDGMTGIPIEKAHYVEA